MERAVNLSKVTELVAELEFENQFGLGSTNLCCPTHNVTWCLLDKEAAHVCYDH